MGNVTFRVGRAGVGKSTRIADEIAGQLSESPLGPPIFWIVPDDASFSTEKLLMQKVSATVRCEILTLQRFAERVNQSVGVVHTARVNTTGKRLLLAKVYQQLADKLSVLGRVEPSVGFLDAVLDVFNEMVRCQISLPQMEGMLEVAASSVADIEKGTAMFAGLSLIGKLKDLCDLYIHWKAELSKYELCDATELMSIVEPHVGMWSDLRDATVYVDGFVDMTRQEQVFLLSVMAHARTSVVSLSMDTMWWSVGKDASAPLSATRQPYTIHENRKTPIHLAQFLQTLTEPDGVYAPQTAALFQELVRGCDERQITWVAEEERVTNQPGRYDRAPDLQLLERQLFGAPGTTDEMTSANHISFHAAQNARVEAQGVAREIVQLAYNERIRYRDIVVVVPSLADYESYLLESFQAFQIPYYADSFPALSTHPLSKFLLASMALVEDNFSTESVLRLLKSDFCGLKREDADWLESYLIHYEIDHVRYWQQRTPWTFAEAMRDDGTALTACQTADRQAESLRQALCDLFLPFYETLHFTDTNPKILASAVWELFGRVGAKRIMAEWMVDADAGQTPMEASLHEQAWQRVVGLISDLHTTSSDDNVPRAFLFQVVRSDLEQQTLTTIPAGVNEVIVTEIHRARGWEADVVFVLGATDGTLPRQVKPVGILHDEEREQFAWLFGTRLGYTAEEKQLAERSTVYSVLTRAKRRLFVTYPLTNTDGKELRATLTLARIRSLFLPGTLSERVWKAGLDDLGTGDSIIKTAPKYALRALIAAMREGISRGGIAPYAPRIFQHYLAVNDGNLTLDRHLRGFRHKTAAESLPEQMACSLYGDPLKTNVHQLETFASCAYQHFVRYGLRVKEPETPDTGAAAKGTLKHDVLLAFVQKHMSDVAAWKSMTDEDAIASIRTVFQETLALPRASIWGKKRTRTEQADGVLREIEHAAVVLTRHARFGAFEPRAMELSFGGTSETDLPGYELELSTGAKVVLRGRIDRIDTAADGERQAFRIIDYKSSQLKIDLTKVAHGLRLQLPIYAAVVSRYSEQLLGHSSEAAGMLYFPIVHKVSLETIPSDEDTALEDVLKEMRAHGLIVNDRTLISWMDARLTDGSNGSNLFPKIYNKNGSTAPHAPVLNPDEWQMFMGRALAHVREMSERILAGDISISPYRLANEDACTWCPFNAVCHLEKRYDLSRFRRLPKFSKEEIGQSWSAFREWGVNG